MTRSGSTRCYISMRHYNISTYTSIDRRILSSADWQWTDDAWKVERGSRATNQISCGCQQAGRNHAVFKALLRNSRERTVDIFFQAFTFESIFVYSEPFIGGGSSAKKPRRFAIPSVRNAESNPDNADQSKKKTPGFHGAAELAT